MARAGNPNGQQAIAGAEIPTLTLNRYISYQYNSYATETAVAVTPIHSTEAIANGQTITVRNQRCCPSSTRSGCCDSRSVPDSNSSFQLINQNGNRVRGTQLGPAPGDVPTYTFTDRTAAAGSNLATVGLQTIAWSFGEIDPGTLTLIQSWGFKWLEVI